MQEVLGSNPRLGGLGVGPLQASGPKQYSSESKQTNVADVYEIQTDEPYIFGGFLQPPLLFGNPTTEHQRALDYLG